MRNKIRIKKIKGFTLVEITVAMLLSGILLSVAVKVVLMIMDLTSIQKSSSSKINDILLLHTLLEENFTCSTRVEAPSTNVVRFTFADNYITKILFSSDEIIIENKEMKDTLRLNCTNVITERLKTDSTLLEKLSFLIKNGNMDYPFFLVKNYQNEVLFSTEKK
jgi:prepilin-type N-terminal cleavage/methylation domain-containing protein